MYDLLLVLNINACLYMCSQTCQIWRNSGEGGGGCGGVAKISQRGWVVDDAQNCSR